MSGEKHLSPPPPHIRGYLNGFGQKWVVQKAERIRWVKKALAHNMTRGKMSELLGIGMSSIDRLVALAKKTPDAEPPARRFKGETVTVMTHVTAVTKFGPAPKVPVTLPRPPWDELDASDRRETSPRNRLIVATPRPSGPVRNAIGGAGG